MQKALVRQDREKMIRERERKREREREIHRDIETQRLKERKRRI